MIQDIVSGQFKIYTNGLNSVKLIYNDFLDANKTLEIFSNPGSKYITTLLSTLFNKKGHISSIDLDITMTLLLTSCLRWLPSSSLLGDDITAKFLDILLNNVV